MFAEKVINPFAKKRSQHAVVSSAVVPNTSSKKLWRLPHVFARTLELPFPSDADVSIDETKQFFRFVASCGGGKTSSMFDGVRAHAVEILPGITKIVIRRLDGGDVAVTGHQRQQPRFGADLWRYRLPPWTQPEKVTAVCTGGKLVVTVPKSRGN
ncbi:uncharacterized protein LOC130721006 [Lotus japonicus]|uniref:uncharacterized protein LOC130721006 n=1 Tax=Lotus japonicus TaxID=34305 RepID=UPI00258FD1C4|nr:uncharacterized protein LOC130721006 [Lotus japonicus]